MKKIIIKFLFAISIFLALSASNLSAQTTWFWRWSHPSPQGNGLRWCKIWDANTFYMTGNGGTFMKTTNAGGSWFINPLAGHYYFNNSYQNVNWGHFFDRNNGIIATAKGLKKTTDGGANFDTIPGTVGAEWPNIYFLNNLTGYAIGEDRIAKTTNGGITWIINLTVFGKDIYTFNDTLIMVLGSGDALKRSTDGGITWIAISTGCSSPRRLNFMNRDTGFICGEYGSVQLTTNSGLNWVSRNTGIPSVTLLDIDFISSGTIHEVFITGDIRYIYKSTNLGLSWDTIGILSPMQVNLEPDPYLGFFSSDFLNSDSILTVGNYGIINSRFGYSRISYNNIIKCGSNNDAKVNDIWASAGNGRVWAVGGYGIGANPYNGNDQIMYSSDGGTSWRIQPTDAPAQWKHLNSISMLDANTGYAGGNAGAFLKTTNGGTNWISLTLPETVTIYKVDFINSSTGWVFGVSGTIYKTTNGGDNWVLQTASAVTDIIYSADMLDENTGWLVGSSGKVSRTTDGGNNWIPQNANVDSYSLYDIKMLNINSGYLCGAVGIARKTTNGGDNWDIAFNPSTSNTFYSLDFVDMSNGIITTFSGKIMRTTNEGQTWTIYNAYTNYAIYASYMVSVDTIFAGGEGASIFKIPIWPPIKVLEWNNKVPLKYELWQNYPNPFNPATTIKFALPEAGNVVLRVYDIAGREVKTLLNNEDLNRGTVTLTFDGSNLASGVYFYSLLVDGKMIDSKKMVLIK